MGKYLEDTITNNSIYVSQGQNDRLHEIMLPISPELANGRNDLF